MTVWEWEPSTFRPVSQTERVSGRDAAQEWTEEQFYAIVTDVVGTPAELVDSEGNVAWHLRATLWGTVAGGEAGGPSTSLRFPGQYYDPETRLNYNYFRYYEPTAHRYDSTDPLGLAGGINPYAYVLNPVAWIDPLGLMSCMTLFGQRSVRRTFTTAEEGSTWKYAGHSVADVASALRRGVISPDELPIEYIVRGRQRIAINNRSLLALRRAGLNPTRTVDLTGDAFAEARITQRLREMGGLPSPTIRVRGAGLHASAIW